MIPSTEEYDKLTPEEKQKVHLDMYEEMWVKKNRYIQKNMDYIYNILKDHNCEDYKDIDRVGELCYVLSKKDDVDMDGKNWSHAYFNAKMFYKTFHPHYQTTEKMRTLEILIDVLQTPILIEKLGIKFEEGIKYSRELMEDIRNISHDAQDHPKPKRWNNSWLINRLADDIFVSMAEQKLPTAYSLNLVLDIYRKYNYCPPPKMKPVKYGTLETQRTRALERSK